MKRLLSAAIVLACAHFAHAGNAPDLWRQEKAMWKTPRSWPAGVCKSEGVEAVVIEGEKYKGQPTRFFAYWGLPAGASETNKVPGIVLVHGGGGTAFDTWVRTWNARGYAAIAMDTCGGIPLRDRELGGWLRHLYSGPRGWGGFKYATPDTPHKDQWPYHAVSTVVRAHSFLRAQKAVRADCIGLTGISWGGYLTACTAGIDERFAFAVPVYGSAYLYDHSLFRENMLKLGDAGKMWDALWDARNFLPSAKMPMLWVTGSNDRFFPLDSLQRGYDLPADPPRLAIRVKMPHGHAPTGDPQEIAAFADHFAFGKPALPAVEAVYEKGRLSVSWQAAPRRISKAQFIFTDSRNPVWEKRPYKTQEVAFSASTLAVPVPPQAVLFWVNLITDDGLVVSSRHFMNGHEENRR